MEPLGRDENLKPWRNLPGVLRGDFDDAVVAMIKFATTITCHCPDAHAVSH